MRDNWKKLLGIAVGASGVFYPPLLPVTTLLGGLIIGTDFQVGSEVGSAIGKGAKKVVNHETLSADELQALADAARLLPSP